MLRRFLNAKIRDLRLTGTHLEYEGSIGLDEAYLEKAGILPDEEVQVLNERNGARFTTYVIKAGRGTGTVELNGPAAHLAKVGDTVMVLSYVLLSEDEVAGHKPRIVRAGHDT